MKEMTMYTLRMEYAGGLVDEIESEFPHELKVKGGREFNFNPECTSASVVSSEGDTILDMMKNGVGGKVVRRFSKTVS